MVGKDLGLGNTASFRNSQRAFFTERFASCLIKTNKK
jgi:hypothetical protein